MVVGWGKGWFHDVPQVQGLRGEKLERGSQGLPPIGFGIDSWVCDPNLEGVPNEIFTNLQQNERKVEIM